MARSFSTVVAVLALVLAVQEGRAQMGYPYLGGMLGSLYGGGFQQQEPELLLTCMSVSPLDPSAQLRLTIRPDTYSGASPTSFPGHLNAFGVGASGDLNMPQEWIVEGVITPGNNPRQGSYYAVVTQFGRTVGGTCHSNALGPAIQGPQSPFVSPFGAFGAFGMGYMGQHPMQQQQPAGLLSNPILLTNGVSSYTARLSGVSYNQINGGGIALCPQFNQGQCLGAIPMCCSITRDQVPATQTILQPGNGNEDFTAVGRFNGPIGIGGGLNGGSLGGFSNQNFLLNDAETMMDGGLDRGTAGLFTEARSDRIGELF